MRRTTAALALALIVLGCGSPNPLSDRVELLTGIQSCYAGGQSPTDGGLLVPDPEYGTRFDGRGPVMWPVGYTGRRLSTGEIQVLNTSGDVIAATGRQYRFSPVPPQGGDADQVMGRVGAVPVCDSYPWDFEEAGE